MSKPLPLPPHRGLRTERYKLIHYAGPAAVDDGTTLSKPKQWRGVDQWELFYLQNDPRERRNLYDLPESKTIVAELKAELNRLCNELGDRE